MSESLAIENLEIGGIFYPYFVINLAKKGRGSKTNDKIIENVFFFSFLSEEQTWLSLFMLSGLQDLHLSSDIDSKCNLRLLLGNPGLMGW